MICFLGMFQLALIAASIIGSQSLNISLRYAFDNDIIRLQSFFPLTISDNVTCSHNGTIIIIVSSPWNVIKLSNNVRYVLMTDEVVIYPASINDTGVYVCNRNESDEIRYNVSMVTRNSDCQKCFIDPHIGGHVIIIAMGGMILFIVMSLSIIHYSRIVRQYTVF